MKRKVCVVVTSRPSYSRVKTVLTALSKNPNVEFQLVIAASALLDRYGSTINFIEKDGFEITAKVFNVLEGENLTSMAKTTGIGILELSTVFDNIKPDVVITIADRYETMATAISASYMNIPLAHIQGGEITGNIDEKVRHSITKLSDIHFASTEKARENIIKMGEDPEFVFNTGCPSIDIAADILLKPELDFDLYKKYGGVGSFPDIRNGYVVVMQHPVTTEYSESKKQIEVTLEAVNSINYPVLFFWPNIDAGADGTSNGIRSFRENKKSDKFHFFKNMESEDFLKLLYNSKCLIGNSSVGIRECSFLGVPVVNIGSRQTKRERGKNVIDVDYDIVQLKNAIDTLLKSGKRERDFIYGDGKSGELISDIIATVPLRFHKTLNY
ncbi:MAG TPA: UDP-N-acetylglucosamine 2-epimerase (hydrolyzing) [Bacteroidetes bacterium]|nr:UDP-N-acetylglucosamine 2-epimerase (hydrolyzing) [Ignavibacteria bacterium]HCA42555.1 UDP-N-acetylglucosamine 2-epimerase (hydrolyzing) [Bacteroidota bacterium]HCN37799.1 UDP-N-acetylglucosamine 2-epimerase (hydrolyzing) [Bacteroidota bacterium]